jgi:hypothetical protein
MMVWDQGWFDTPKLSVNFWRRFLIPIDKIRMVWYNEGSPEPKKMIPT